MSEVAGLKEYVVTVTRLGRSWARVYVTKSGQFRLRGAKVARGKLTELESIRVRRWAKRRGYRVRVVAVSQDPFKAIQSKFNLRRSSGDNEKPGSHARGSYHYRAASWGGVQAYDYGNKINKRENLVKAGESAKRKASDWKEVFGPFPWYIKNGVVHKGAFPDHDDHLHLARSKPL